MKYLLIILVFLTKSCQIQKIEEKLQLFTDEDIYDWRICVEPSREYLESEIPKLRKHFNEYIANIDSIERFFHFVDINGDNNLDVIYSGTSGSASDYVVFLLKVRNDYEILFYESTNIRELTLDKNRLIGYTGLDLGCCADYVIKETKYKVSKDWKRSVIYCRAMTAYSDLPKSILDKPIKFKIVDDVQKMRSSPIVDDSSMFIYDTISNVVTSYIKGSTGFAWSQKQDTTGQLWWFVEMEPNNNQIGSKINSKYDSIPIRNLGWMNLKYLGVN